MRIHYWNIMRWFNTVRCDQIYPKAFRVLLGFITLTIFDHRIIVKERFLIPLMKIKKKIDHTLIHIKAFSILNKICVKTDHFMTTNYMRDKVERGHCNWILEKFYWYCFKKYNALQLCTFCHIDYYLRFLSYIKLFKKKYFPCTYYNLQCLLIKFCYETRRKYNWLRCCH